MMRVHFMMKLVGAGLLAMGFNAGAAQALVIDDFTQGAGELVGDSGQTIYNVQENLSPDHVLTGTRITYFKTLETESLPRVTIGATGTPGFAFTSPEASASSTVSLVYGYSPALSSPSQEPPLEGIDLAAFGNRFLVRNISMDTVGEDWQGIIDINVTSRTSSGRTISFKQEIINSRTASSNFLDRPTNIYLDFDRYSFVDMSSIVGVEFRIWNSIQNVASVTFDGIYVVPEPASLTLLGLGGMAGLLRRRRG